MSQELEFAIRNFGIDRMRTAVSHIFQYRDQHCSDLFGVLDKLQQDSGIEIFNMNEDGISVDFVLDDLVLDEERYDVMYKYFSWLGAEAPYFLMKLWSLVSDMQAVENINIRSSVAFYETALEEARSVLNFMPEPLFVINENWFILDSNLDWEYAEQKILFKKLWYSQHEFISTDFWWFFPVWTVDRVEKYMVENMKDGAFLETRIRAKNGIWIVVQLILKKVDGKSLVILVDSSGIKAVERELNDTYEELNTKVEELASTNKILQDQFTIFTILNSTISHDLRWSIGNNADLLEIVCDEFGLDDDVLDAVGAVQVSLQKSYLFVQKVMELISNPSFANVFYKEKIDLSSLETDLIEQMLTSFNRKSVKLSFDWFDKEISVAWVALYTILHNLVENALKFTSVGGTVSVLFEEFDDSLKFSVKDNGVWMSEEMKRNVFFWNKKSIMWTGEEKGSGLWLRLCERYVDGLKWKIWVEQSELWKWTTICCEIPKD